MFSRRAKTTAGAAAGAVACAYGLPRSIDDSATDGTSRARYRRAESFSLRVRATRSDAPRQRGMSHVSGSCAIPEPASSPRLVVLFALAVCGAGRLVCWR